MKGQRNTSDDNKNPEKGFWNVQDGTQCMVNPYPVDSLRRQNHRVKKADNSRKNLQNIFSLFSQAVRNQVQIHQPAVARRHTGSQKRDQYKNSNRDFKFDILMANPPFAGDIKESRILSKYELSKNAAGKMASKVGRDILFIERNLDFLKPGGRMAIVLPQGRFNN